MNAYFVLRIYDVYDDFAKGQTLYHYNHEPFLLYSWWRVELTQSLPFFIFATLVVSFAIAWLAKHSLSRWIPRVHDQLFYTWRSQLRFYTIMMSNPWAYYIEVFLNFPTFLDPKFAINGPLSLEHMEDHWLELGMCRRWRSDDFPLISLWVSGLYPLCNSYFSLFFHYLLGLIWAPIYTPFMLKLWAHIP